MRRTLRWTTLYRRGVAFDYLRCRTGWRRQFVVYCYLDGTPAFGPFGVN